MFLNIHLLTPWDSIPILMFFMRDQQKRNHIRTWKGQNGNGSWKLTYPISRLVLLSRWFSFFQGGMCDRSLEVSDRSARTLFRWLVPHAWHHVLPALAVPCCHVKIPPAFPTSCIEGRRFIHKFPMCKCLAEQAVYVKPWLRFWNMFAKIFNIHKTNTLEGWCKHQIQKKSSDFRRCNSYYKYIMQTSCFLFGHWKIADQ